MVPITVAAGAAALAATAAALVLSITGMPAEPDALVMSMVLVAGLGVFGLAMWWDRSDRVSQTRRSDVAFWLHLQIGRAHVWTPVSNAYIVCRILLYKKKTILISLA